MSQVPKQRNVWRRRCLAVFLLWISTTLVFSFDTPRSLLIAPLVCHHEEAHGDIAYVMAGGPASWERLIAASDLYHMERVKRIVVLSQSDLTSFNFVDRKNETRSERSIAYLQFRGVPRDVITTVKAESQPLFGSLSEAQAVAESEKSVSRIVVVTSAPHTRRSLMCFRRSFPDSVEIDVYAASTADESDELSSPIWMEYVKLAVYFCAA